MIKLNIKTFLLATSAICTVETFANNANAQYSPTLTRLHDAGAKIPGVTPDTDYPESVYTVTPVGSCSESTSATGGCFKTVSGYNESGNPIYQYYTYTVNTISDDKKAGRVVNDPDQIAANNEAGKSYVGNYDEDYPYGGGAIRSSSTISAVIAHFIGNYAGYNEYDGDGGAIYNSQKITSIAGDFIANHAQDSTAYGGAIFNIPKYATNSISGDFIGNYARGKDVNGGAIFNSRGLQSLIGNFIGNYTYSDVNSDYSASEGGAVYNSATINSISGNFISNYAYSDYFSANGGAIYNYYTNTIESISGDFIFNHAQGLDASGGAIYNYPVSTIGSITGNFVGNYVHSDYDFDKEYEFYVDPDNTYAGGGAISASGTINYITGNFIGNYAINETSEAYGGAISSSASIKSIIGDFKDNYVQGNEAKGGAVAHNYSTIGSITGDFKGNYAHGSPYAYGGAIYNEGTINSIAGDFIGNYAYGSQDAFGGAIYNVGNIKSITGDFIDNYVYFDYTADGGAIYNTGTMTFVADAANADYEDDILFKGNYTHCYGYYGNEAIYNEGTITFKSRNNGSYTFMGNYISGYVDIDGDTYSDAVLKFVAESGTGTLNLYGPASIMAQKQVVFDDANNDGSKWIINTINNDFEDLQLQNLNILTPTALNIDVDMDSKRADIFDISYYEGGSGTLLTLGYINLIGTFDASTTPIVYSYTGDTITTPGTVNVQDDFYVYGFTNSGYDLTYNGENTKKSFVPTLSKLNHDEAIDPATDEVYIKSAYRAILTDADDYDFYVINDLGEKEYYKYVVNVSDDKKAERVNNNPTKVAENNVAGKSYIGIRYEDDSALGGAIYNESATDYITGDFIANYTSGTSASGGAIYNSGTVISVTGDFINDKADGGSVSGGAIYNSGAITSVIGNFIADSLEGTSATGGAVHNEGTITTLSGSFIDNNAQGSSEAHGGAIYSTGTITSVTGDLMLNNAQGASVTGGAVHNEGTITTLKGSFTDNYAEGSSEAHGGAIYNSGTIGILADNSDILFQGNYVKVGDGAKQYEAIYNDGASANLTFKSLNDGSYTLYDYINGDDNATVNFVAESGTGTLTLHGDAKIIGQKQVNFKDTDDDGSEWIINAANNTIESTQIDNLNILTPTTLNIDVNLDNKTADTFTITYLAGGSGTLLTLGYINIIGTFDGSAATIAYSTGTTPITTPSTVLLPGDFYDYTFANSGYDLTYTGEYKEKLYVPTLSKLNHEETIDPATGEVYVTSAYLVNMANNTNYDFYVFNSEGEKEYYKYGAKERGDIIRDNVVELNFDSVPDDAQNYSWSSYKYVYNYYYGGVGLKHTSGTANVANNYVGNVLKGEFVLPSDYSGVYSSIYPNVYGGVIYNSATLSSIVGDFIENGVETSSSSEKSGVWVSDYADGGAIYNSGTITSITGDFIANYVKSTSAYGGAIYNEYDGTIGTIKGNFVSNYTLTSDSYDGTSEGGAIYNGGTITSITGDFINNKSRYGGGIYNSGTIESVTGNFIANNSEYGGAVYNYYGTINSINGDFIGNEAEFGAAIYNYGTIESVVGTFKSNKSRSGGAIYNQEYSNVIESIRGDFIGNYAYSDDDYNSYASGGAIYNDEVIESIAGNFVGNYAFADIDDEYSGAYGGAIYNTWDPINSITGDFTGNYAKAKAGEAKGGAIYSYVGTINFVADAGNAAYENDILFKGNYVKVGDGAKQYEAIYSDGYEDEYYTTITFTSRNNGSYTFYDYINGNGYGEVDFTATDGTGTLKLYNDIKGQGDINFTGDWNLDMRSAHNDETETPYNSITAGNIVVNDGLSTAIDINFADYDAEAEGGLTVDRFYATTSGSGIITLDTINLIGTPTAKTVRVIYAPTNDLQLALGDAYDDQEVLLGTTETETIDPVVTPLKWSDVLYHRAITTNVYGTYALATTSTTYDSIILSGIREEEIVSPTSLGDTLALMARSADLDEAKNFNADPAAEAESITYTLSEDIGALKGTLNINGSTTVPSTLNLNNKAGFTLGEGATALNFNNLTVGGNTTIANVTNSSATIGMDNVTLNGAITGNAASISATDSTINANLVGTAVSLANSTMTGNISATSASLTGSTITGNISGVTTAVNLRNATVNGNIGGTAGYAMAVDGNNTLKGTITGANIKLHQSTAGTLTLGSDSAFVNSSMTVYGGTVDTVNKKTGTVNLNNLTVAGTTTMNVEIDLESAIMDNINATSITVSSGTLNLSFTLLSQNSNTTTKVAFVGENQISAKNLVYATNISSDYTYNVTFDAENGVFVFTNTSRKTPGRTGGTKSVASSTSATTATTGAVAGETMSHGGATVSSGMNSGDEPLGLSAWVKAFGSSDDVELKNLSQKIDTQFHGIVGGIDSKRFAYDNGLSAVYGVFGAYVQGRQKTDDNKTTQKSGYLGLSAALRKEAVFSNFSLIGGFIANESNTPWGKDKFDTKVVSVANQTGVDIRKDEWTITPSLTLSYAGIDTDDYTAKSGVKVENKFMNVFTVAPELKVAKDFGEGLEGYTKAAYKMFFYDNNKITADDVLMPTISVKPYVEYGVGLKKDWSKEEWNPRDVTSYAEITRHDGGREGWNINLGLKFDF